MMWNKSAVESEAISVLSRYLDDMNSKGLLSEFDYLDDSEDFFWVPPGYSSPLDFDSVKTILITNAPLLKSIRNEWTQLRVQPLSGDHCVYTGEIASMTISQSDDTSAVDMLETGILVKRDDGWKILCGQSRIKE